MTLSHSMARRSGCTRQLFLLCLLFFASPSFSQSVPNYKTLAFVSDTQAPMWIETIWLKKNNNTLATSLIFNQITQCRPASLFILGDVVSLGRKESRWRDVDRFLSALHDRQIPVYALLGNHDVMGNANKGENAFNKRFPDHVKTGYFKIVDSTAVIMLNSNFGALSIADQGKQQSFYKETLHMLDQDPAVRVIIVSCHHAPYTNSTIVGVSVAVQEKFVPDYIQSRKARLFITGHAHDFEWFQILGKDFLTIGGGGGLHQPLRTDIYAIPNQSIGYTPEFHYEFIERDGRQLKVTSYHLKPDFSGFEEGFHFVVSAGRE